MEIAQDPILAPYLREGVGPIILKVETTPKAPLSVVAHRKLGGARVKLILSKSLFYLPLAQGCELLQHVGMYSGVPTTISIERRGDGIPWLSVDGGEGKPLQGCHFATKAKKRVKKISLFVKKIEEGQSSKFNCYSLRPKGGMEIVLVHRAKSKGYLFQDEAAALLRALKAPANKRVCKRIEIGQKEGKRLWVRVDNQGKGGKVKEMYLKTRREPKSHPRTETDSGVQMTPLNENSKQRTQVVSHRSSEIQRAFEMTGQVKTWLSLYDKSKRQQWVVEVKSKINLGQKVEIVYWHVKKKKVYLSEKGAKQLLATLDIEEGEVPKTMTIGVEERNCLRVQLGQKPFKKIAGFILSTQPIPEKKEELGEEIEWEGKNGELGLILSPRGNENSEI